MVGEQIMMTRQNAFNPSMVGGMAQDEDLLKSLAFKNPEAPEIDNSPGFMAKLVQGFLKAGATAAGGAAGGAAADAVSDSYNASQEMPAAGNITQQQMATTPTLNLQAPLADTSSMVASSSPLNPVVPMVVTDLDMNNNTPAWQNYMKNKDGGRYIYQSRFDRHGNPTGGISYG